MTQASESEFSERGCGETGECSERGCGETGEFSERGCGETGEPLLLILPAWMAGDGRNGR